MKRLPLIAIAGVSAAALMAGSAFAWPGERGHHRGGDMLRGMMGLKMLQAADANGDKSVTRAEVDALQIEMFAWLDRNGDGVLDLADRSPIEQRMAAIHENDEEGGPRKHHRGGHDAFGFDADKDGKVTREEFMSKPSEGFDKLDANSDGVVTPDEIDAALDRGKERRMWWRDG